MALYFTPIACARALALVRTVNILTLIALLLPVVAILIQAVVQITLTEGQDILTEVKVALSIFLFIGAYSFYLAARDSIILLANANVNPLVVQSLESALQGLSVLAVVVFFVILSMFRVFHYVQSQADRWDRRIRERIAEYRSEEPNTIPPQYPKELK